MKWRVLVGCLVCVWGMMALDAHASLRTARTRLALILGNNQGGSSVPPLRYAEADARKMRDALVQVAGYKPSSVWLALGKRAPQVRVLMKRMKRTIRSLLRRNKGPVFLLVYYSGHAKQGSFLLGKTKLPFRELRHFLRTSGAALRLSILDACESGRMARLKGLRRKKARAPSLRLAPLASGEVVITATGERESAHEDPFLRGGIFTHYFVSGLRGAADRDRNGRVTLEELYRYAYTRTLERTILSAQGPQHAHFRKQLSGVGQWIMAYLRRPQSWLLLRKNVAGAFYIWNTRRDTLLVEVNKFRGRRTTIALPPGQYVLQWRRRTSLYSSSIKLHKGQRMQLRKRGQRIAFAYDFRAKGGSTTLSWEEFGGQMEGHALGVQYRGGWSGIDQGIWHHGPSLGWLMPLPQVFEGRFSLRMRLTYQMALSVPALLNSGATSALTYDLHALELDMGAVWTFWHRRSLWMGLGLRVRGAPLLQVVRPGANRTGEDILSVALGAGLFWTAQFQLTGRLFLQVEADAGVRTLPLGDRWVLRWATALGVGIGWRL